MFDAIFYTTLQLCFIIIHNIATVYLSALK